MKSWNKLFLVCKNIRRTTTHNFFDLRITVVFVPPCHNRNIYTRIFQRAQTNRCHYGKWSYCILVLFVRVIAFRMGNSIESFRIFAFIRFDGSFLDFISSSEIDQSYLFRIRTGHPTVYNNRRRWLLMRYIPAYSRKWYTFIDDLYVEPELHANVFKNQMIDCNQK